MNEQSSKRPSLKEPEPLGSFLWLLIVGMAVMVAFSVYAVIDMLL